MEKQIKERESKTDRRTGQKIRRGERQMRIKLKEEATRGKGKWIEDEKVRGRKKERVEDNRRGDRWRGERRRTKRQRADPD
ncbi:hypothetical protein Zmor_002253 [Zophobas morio]|uniref:Uncharacterized protein n=1 Tax=Zophobas morio TaxID=2755281 RepID=A0AA38J9D6_9CUCU|nr:hypothetical protein Zmor_002253 [Zophobas morio]